MSGSGRLDGAVTFERRSTYWACTGCGALVVGDDRNRHRAHHAALAGTVAALTESVAALAALLPGGR